MNNEEVLKALTPIFHKVFNNTNIILNIESNAMNIDGWDSLNHINLMVEIQESLDIKFSVKEIRSLNDIGTLVNLIQAKNV
jgi:acyl carrier protein